MTGANSCCNCPRAWISTAFIRSTHKNLLTLCFHSTGAWTLWCCLSDWDSVTNLGHYLKGI